MKLGGMGELLGPPGGKQWLKNAFVQRVVLNEDLEIIHPKFRMLHIHVHPKNIHLTTWTPSS